MSSRGTAASTTAPALIPELRGELEAHPTDVAIVAAAFDRWETDCFRRLDRRLGGLHLEARAARTTLRRRLHGHPAHLLLPEERPNLVVDRPRFAGAALERQVPHR
jgi:hypothetical protein